MVAKSPDYKPPVTEEEMKAEAEGLSEAEEETEKPEEKKKYCDQGLCSVCKYGIRVQRENIAYPYPPSFSSSMYSLGSQIQNAQVDNYYICELKANEICEDFERKE